MGGWTCVYFLLHPHPLYGPEHTCTYSENKSVMNGVLNVKIDMKWNTCLKPQQKTLTLSITIKLTHKLMGVAMGSPRGPLFADIYVNYLEEKLMPRLTRNGVIYWKRSVDDIFAVINKDADINKISVYLIVW